MLKRVLYSSGALGALAGAYLLGGAALGTAFGQTPAQPTTQTATQQGAQDQDGPDGPDSQDQPTFISSIQVPPGNHGQTKAERATYLASLAKITPEQAKAAALAQFPGATVQKVELDNENGSLVYSVQLTDTAGKSTDVKVDAGNAKVLATEADGPDGADDAETAD